MSVILDALQKARTDRRKTPDEPHANSVARVLEPVMVAPGSPAAAPAARGRQWMLPVLVLLVVLLLAACAGVAYIMLFTQVQKLAATAAPAGEIKRPALAGEIAAASAAAEEATLPVAPPPGTSAAAANAQLSVAPAALVSPALPPPAPLSELPVQPPAAAPAANAPIANKGAAAAAPEFKLGSIVCEGSDCIAHLNSRTVRVGDQVRQYRVAQINNTSLVLQGPTPDDVITLSLYD